MKTPGARLLALAVALAATGAGTFSLAPAAQASACEQASGVTVVVDHGNTGGASIGCATGDPATGLEALAGSGHSYTFVPRQPGLVCTVDAKPDPCNNAQANAYWSYWHARPGGSRSWIYSTAGAGTYNPEPGSVEGWSFGDGKPPSLTIGAALAATSSSTTASANREQQTDGKGGVGGLAVGIGLVVPLGAGAAYLAWRRRQLSN